MGCMVQFPLRTWGNRGSQSIPFPLILWSENFPYSSVFTFGLVSFSLIDSSSHHATHLDTPLMSHLCFEQPGVSPNV